MKKPGLLLGMTMLFIVSCDKEEKEADFNFVDLNIVKTETPRTVSLGQPIVSRMTVSGPDLCYKFRRTDVRAEAGNRYIVQAIGTYPKGNPVCAQAVYASDVSVDINPLARGAYYFEFTQNDRRIKTDTVVVQ